MKYQYGVVAYLNGIEVYRDNMSDGQPSIDTLASDSYSSYDYRGVIRSASDVSVSNVLAVEVHFSKSNHGEIIQWIRFSILAGMSSLNYCLLFFTKSLFWYQLMHRRVISLVDKGFNTPSHYLQSSGICISLLLMLLLRLIEFL